ncbi:MAG: GDP-mannose 4,6-dehydratase [Candidatus Woesearchaeota archaeon]|nr:GDP-mannose 4,6-dehydratase [Candidatus Woesearchaeota archaeon]
MNILIVGGAGFIGINAAKYFADKGETVVILDDFSREGTEKNIAWLKEAHDIEVIRADITKDIAALNKAAETADVILHLAAQVAVTTSVENPRHDFMVNALGTFNVLEAARASPKKPQVQYASTNKVYGGMEHLSVAEKNGRYEYEKHPNGVAEDEPLDFHSPYGCSKGAGDQYVRDYARIYGLDTVSFRQSCIYGTRQFGVEDQGWVAWFTIAAVMKKPITIYGDGKQIRDVLFVEDLVKLYELAMEKRKECAGNIYNVGGGPENTMSLLELLDILKEEGYETQPTYDDWRPGDQKVFVANIDKAAALGWKPTVSTREGVKKLIAWVGENKTLFE